MDFCIYRLAVHMAQPHAQPEQTCYSSASYAGCVASCKSGLLSTAICRLLSVLPWIDFMADDSDSIRGLLYNMVVSPFVWISPR